MSEHHHPRFCHVCGGAITGKYRLYRDGLVVCRVCVATCPRCELCDRPSRLLASVQGTQACSLCLKVAPLCAFCAKPYLRGWSLHGGTLHICEECELIAQRCELCAQPFVVTSGGAAQRFCPECLRGLPLCTFCREPILEGRVYNDGALYVCHLCEQRVPHCELCAIPSNELQPVEGKAVCPACLKQTPRCACCHQAIVGRYVQIDDSPLRYCAACITKPRYDICRVPLDEHGVALPGKHGEVRRCATCYSTAISSPGEAEALYRETAGLLEREFGIATPALPPLYLVERGFLEQAHHGESQGMPDEKIPLGAEHQHLLGLFRQRHEKRYIYIEQYLPRPLFIAVAAHEKAHDWQSYNTPGKQSLFLSEGFVEWVAWRAMIALGEIREGARLTRRSDLYGQGLQHYIALERAGGRRAVFQQAARIKLLDPVSLRVMDT